MVLATASTIALVLGGGGLHGDRAAGGEGSEAIVRAYDLGEIAIDDGGPLGPLPVRLWGAIGVPSDPGPHPLVIVAHGRHGDVPDRRARLSDLAVLRVLAAQ